MEIVKLLCDLFLDVFMDIFGMMNLVEYKIVVILFEFVCVKLYLILFSIEKIIIEEV